MKSLCVTLTRLYGLILLFQSIGSLVMCASMFMEGGMTKSGTGYVWALAMNIVISLAFSLFLLFKAESLARWLKIEDRETPERLHGDLLPTGITLVGLYIFISSAPGLLFSILQYYSPDTRSVTYVDVGSVVPHLLKSALAVFLVLYPARVMALVGAGDRRSKLPMAMAENNVIESQEDAHGNTAPQDGDPLSSHQDQGQ